MKNLKFTTRFHENRPFSIGDLTFWSKRLNGAEEMVLQDLQFKGELSLPAEGLADETEILAAILNARERDGQRVDAAWVQARMGKFTTQRLIAYLRTGEGLKPGETLDLPVFEGFELEGRRFSGRALSFAEALAAVQRTDALNPQALTEDADDLRASEPRPGESASAFSRRLMEEARVMVGRTQDLSRVKADVVADLLNSRIEDGGEPISGDWLLHQLTQEDINLISWFLREGEVPDPPEEEAPNAGDAEAAAG